MSQETVQVNKTNVTNFIIFPVVASGFLISNSFPLGFLGAEGQVDISALDPGLAGLFFRAFLSYYSNEVEYRRSYIATLY
ncbi:hypothetical protein L211DRAFT_839363 [Terfezia boudieri ATCC MYA-4762]|uniref:Uncharacterized protein n=1 Tax=Terfezia boudieri ATCC MYA-4762 TaxID=1051890 RepID=A0A3N4LID2_9PEZI|nr:hypothetical protein L211DRAFT_839363 [Terfezia boudieri ATCC MYA-4762]